MPRRGKTRPKVGHTGHAVGRWMDRAPEEYKRERINPLVRAALEELLPLGVRPDKDLMFDLPLKRQGMVAVVTPNARGGYTMITTYPVGETKDAKKDTGSHVL